VKPKDLDDARAIAKKLEDGTITRRDLIAFLIYIRESIPNDMVKDLAHFVAHPQRNKGFAFDYTEAFAARVVSVFIAGGDLKVSPIFEFDPADH